MDRQKDRWWMNGQAEVINDGGHRVKQEKDGEKGIISLDGRMEGRMHSGRCMSRWTVQNGFILSSVSTQQNSTYEASTICQPLG